MEKTGGSRLLQMQARFQQKQMQERELKIASLYESQQARALDRVRHSPSNGVSEASTPPEPPIPRQPGKVRQMFEERRTKAGIDKSYPLQPIHNTERTAARKALPNGYTKVTNSRTSVERKAAKTHMSSTTVSVKKQHKVEKNIVNGSGDLNHNHEPDLNSVKHELSYTNGDLVPHLEGLDRVDNNYLLENETFPEGLAPATPRSPEPHTEPQKPPRKSPTTKSSPTKVAPAPAPAAPPRKVTSEKTVAESSKGRGVMQRGSHPVPKKQPPSGVSSPRKPATSSSRVAGSSSRAPAAAAGGEGDACIVCGRRFASDRIEKHQSICRKTQTKKRKPFDALKHRLAGTEAEPFLNKLRKGGGTSSTKVSKPLNNNWRKKHEEFIQAIRAAKQVQAHLDAGGKLSDLPPPPPSENPDYVQCPHCNRRFNRSAADRHIPKCATYQFNKPKPNAKRR